MTWQLPSGAEMLRWHRAGDSIEAISRRTGIRIHNLRFLLRRAEREDGVKWEAEQRRKAEQFRAEAEAGRQ